MFFKILRKDLKRKKAMNIILFLFMIIASMLIASSVNLLYTTTTALEHFKKISKVADNIILTISDEKNDKLMEEWAQNNSLIKSFVSLDMLYISGESINLSSPYQEKINNQALLLQKMPTDYNLIFNQHDERFDLEDGQIALPAMFKDGIKLGDEITIKVDNIEKQFTVTSYIKDVIFGSGYMGIKRVVISDQDYDNFLKSNDKLVMKLWSLTKNENVSYEDLEKDFSKTSISSTSIFNNATVSFSYVMDLILAAIMMIVSIFLILISFLILRFTIIFTIEEDYKEIGIMKAIGLRDKGIKGIYMVKYFAMATVGGGLGYLASNPFSAYLLKSISEKIMMKATFINYILSAMSVIGVILITIGFCQMCTSRIKKLSAIDAIRQGSTGERFHISKKLKLHNMKRMSTPIYFAVSDIINGIRKFKILIITFILGTVIIIIPLNTINTLNSSSVLALFGLGDIDFKMGTNSFALKHMKNNSESLLKVIREFEKQAEEVDLDVSIYPDLSFVVKTSTDNSSESRSVAGYKSINYSADRYSYLEGSPPKLANEIAITTLLAEYFDIGLGDTINCTVDDRTDQFIVTALFQSMNNMGYNLRYSEQYDLGVDKSIGFTLFGLFNDKDVDEKLAINKLKELFPELEVKSRNEYIQSIMGDITGSLAAVKNIILIIILGMNFLITSLLVRMFITKEIPEIAVLKSIGYKDKEIKKWQTARITIILVISIILGTILASLTGGFITSGIFKMMGATQIDLVIKPLEVFVIYPVILIIFTTLAVLSSLGRVRKTNVWEVNNQE